MAIVAGFDVHRNQITFDALDTEACTGWLFVCRALAEAGATAHLAEVAEVMARRGHFPDDESARKLVYLAIRNHETTWKRPMAGWYECLAAFHAHFQDRLTRHS